jgi:hypothetical protein
VEASGAQLSPPNNVAGRDAQDSNAEKFRNEHNTEKKVDSSGLSLITSAKPSKKQRLGVGFLLMAMQKHRLLQNKPLQQPAAAVQESIVSTNALMDLLVDGPCSDAFPGGSAPASPQKPGADQAVHEPEGDGSIQVAPPPPPQA